MNKVILSIFLLFTNAAFSQSALKKFEPKISYAVPDPLIWHLEVDHGPNDETKGVLLFKHDPVKDKAGNTIIPAISIIYENVPEDIDPIEYSNYLTMNMPHSAKTNLLGSYPKYTSDRHAVVFDGSYTRDGHLHKIYVCCILYHHKGYEVVEDCTEDVFDLVKDDFLKFLKSVHIND